MVRHRAPLNPVRAIGCNPRARKCAELCTSLCMNGGQRVDDGRNPGGNEKVQGITLCFSKYHLTRGYCGVFTDARSGERTPTGAVRRGLRPSPHRSRGESGIGARTVFTATSDRAVGLLREDEGNDESANVTGDRGGRRVRPGRRHLRVAAETETCWIVRRARGNPQPASGSARRPGTLGAFGRRVICRLRVAWCVTRCTFGWGAGNGVVVEEPKELGPPQLDSARSVPGTRTEGSGNRVSVKRCHGFEAGKPVSSPKRGIARRAERRDGRCEQVETKANARHSTSGGPVHPSSPGRRAGESQQRRPGRFRFRCAASMFSTVATISTPASKVPEDEDESARGSRFDAPARNRRA